MNDADVRRNVETELKWEPSVINAAAMVQRYFEKWGAERAAWASPGVYSVEDRIAIGV